MSNKDFIDVELPEKIKNILDILDKIENSIDEEFPDDDWMWDWDYPFIHRRLMKPLGPILKRVFEGGDVNIVPKRYGIPGKCEDTLVVFIEPSFWFLQPDEWHPEMRLKKRIESALNVIKSCNTRYVIFWASIWEFRMWRKYKPLFSNQIVILRPYKEDKIILNP
ncbi:MAG: hypothetical protein ACP5IB_08375 [Thermoplasmata archaeon]